MRRASGQTHRESERRRVQPPCQSSDNPERITAANTASLGDADGDLCASLGPAAHAKGYRAGFYGFSQSSAAAIATAAGNHKADLPDALWYARYDNNADPTTGFPFATGLWTGHRRGHQ
ncbi:hypothetical protein [Streptomyces sp. RKAG293]|uniref:hypothetical protein n=1 Tax=Streptomyces sp. RKAG293 TaxID=2893403 RepID=UPI002552501E|nr:hypothetical protein [Streptomyces sp. RKAG293]